jgi:hypothetical protein
MVEIVIIKVESNKLNVMQRKIILMVLVLGLVFLAASESSAQYAERKLSKKQQAYVDSLKQVEYPYIFPFLGQKAYRNGFDIPYPAGIMANYIWMDQGIVIDNFQLGIESPNASVPLSPAEFIGFSENRNTSYAFNVRPDLWIFPFLNVYGLFGYGSSTTEVNLSEPVQMKSVVQQQMSTAGFGLMGAFGLGPLWMSVDGNWTWTFPELLEDPVSVRLLGVRLGHTYQFKNHPERNLGIWIGGMRARMGSSTLGAVTMADALPQETWDRADEIVDNYNTWYDGLDPVMKAIVDNSAFPAFIEALDDRDGSTVISYGMDKSPEQEWNVVVGGQFQLNKRWQFRTEGGIIGDRKSFLISANYRFRI